MNKLTFLGTGTSSGVPVNGCDCEVCKSKDPKDNRLRTSAYITTEDGTKILIDVGPDFRLQALRTDIRWIDGILVTHSHQDHIGGIDELRQINFLMGKEIDVFGTELAMDEIKRRFDYIFMKTQDGGGKPQIRLSQVQGKFAVRGHSIIPIPVMHGEIPILGYRIGDLTYITDASFIPDKSLELIQGSRILIINALRPKPHPTHFSLDEAIGISEKIKPSQTYFIHLTHLFMHRRDDPKLPENCHFAYDGLELEFE